MKEFTIKVSGEIHKLLKKEAKKTKKSMKALVEEIITNQLASQDGLKKSDAVKEIIKLEYLEMPKPVKILKEIFKSWENETGHIDWSKPAIFYAGWLPAQSSTEKKWIDFYEEQVETNAGGDIFWNFFTNYSTPEEFAKDWVEKEEVKSYIDFCKKYQD